MKIQKPILYTTLILTCLVQFPVQPVYSETGIMAIVSSSATCDNKPLLWINYESTGKNIALYFFHGPRYDFTGVLQEQDTSGVLMGLNTAGFALAYTLTSSEASDSSLLHSQFVKKALGYCGSLTDFEELLINHRDGVNIGCFDAEGACALYEMCPNKIVKYDVNDSSDCPDGWLVRDNFSFTCDMGFAISSWRYHRVNGLLRSTLNNHTLDYKYLLQNIARDICPEEMNLYPLPFTGHHRNGPEGYINTTGTINRHNTQVCAVFQGTNKIGKTSLPTFWLTPGEPVCGVAVPIWPQSGKIPKELTGKSIAKIDRVLEENQSKLYHKKNWPYYLDTKVLAFGKDAMLTVLLKKENEIFRETTDMQKTFANTPHAYRQLENFQKKMLYMAIK